MTTLTQEHQSLLSQILNLMPDTARNRFAEGLGLTAEQFRQGITASLGKLVTTIQERENDPTFRTSVIKLIPHLNAQQAVTQIQQFNPSATVDNGLEHLAQLLLGNVFGNRIDTVSDTIAVTSRVSQPASMGLLNVAAASLLAYLGQAIIPSGLLSWGSHGVKPNGTAAVGSATAAPIGSMSPKPRDNDVRDRKTGLPGWLAPVALAALAILGLITFWPKARPVNDVAATNQAVKYTSTDVVRSASNQDLGRMIAVTLPNGMDLTIPENGIENQLLRYIQNPDRVVDKTTWFNFDRIMFDSAKSTLKPASAQQLDNMSAILSAYPQVNLKIGGYTDSSGNAKANQILSLRRASAVMSHLTGLGVKADRLKAEGYGNQRPVESNATPEGRAMNRRIAVRVTQK